MARRGYWALAVVAIVSVGSTGCVSSWAVVPAGAHSVEDEPRSWVTPGWDGHCSPGYIASTEQLVAAPGSADWSTVRLEPAPERARFALTAIGTGLLVATIVSLPAFLLDDHTTPAQDFAFAATPSLAVASFGASAIAGHLARDRDVVFRETRPIEAAHRHVPPHCR